MAATAINPTQLIQNRGAAIPATVAIDAIDGALVDFTVADHKALLIFEAASAVTATIQKGNGIQGVSDLAIPIPANGRMCVTIESMKYVDSHGANCGKLRITGAGVKAACVVLP